MIRSIRSSLVTLLLSCAVVPACSLATADEPSVEVSKVEVTVHTVAKKPEAAPLVQIALLLDTSNSMDGLIRQAQDQLWAIVNELAEKKRHGQRPRLEVALFEYGNNSLPATENYIRQIVPLTGDLDAISEALFELKTNGGSEYCGAVVSEATSVLDWKPGDDHYKAIFIAGNEAFTQGGVEYRSACSRAKGEGVVVNTIHCGNEREGIQGKWRDAARLGGGDFLTINQDHAVRHLECPQDAEILRLNIELNSTYLPFGEQGEQGARRQTGQDESAAGIAADTLARRAVSKAQSNAYRNESWDLIDAVESDEELLSKLDDDALPDHLKGKTVEEQKAMIAASAESRKQIQAKIAKLGKERSEYVKQERAKAGQDHSLGTAVQELIRKQAADKGFE
jgi:hypothetical protein